MDVCIEKPMKGGRSDMLSKAIEEVFDEEYLHFKNYIRSRFSTINEYDAEDIIQQTVLTLLSKGNDKLSINNISAYMYTALRNGAVDHIRKRKNETLNIDDVEIVDKHTVETQVLLSELKVVLKNAIDKLDDKSKYVFVETEIKGRSYKDLVNETGIKLGTLLSRKSRTANKLRQMLEEYINNNIT